MLLLVFCESVHKWPCRCYYKSLVILQLITWKHSKGWIIQILSVQKNHCGRRRKPIWVCFFFSGCTISSPFNWNTGHVFQNPVLLTSSLILYITPERQVWYKICLGFVITMAWWYLELEKVIEGFHVEPSPSLSALSFLWENQFSFDL